MLETLRQLKRDNISVTDTAGNLLDIDKFDTEFDRRLCLVIAILDADPDVIEAGEPHDDIVTVDGAKYFVACDDGDADQACTERIRTKATNLDVNFLSARSNFSTAVFQALANSGAPDANRAILALISGSDGLPRFVKRIITAKGRAHFLGEERELTYGDNRTGRTYRRVPHG